MGLAVVSYCPNEFQKCLTSEAPHGWAVPKDLNRRFRALFLFAGFFGFEHVEFRGATSFKSVAFQKILKLKDVQFNGKAPTKFRSASFEDAVVLENVVFEHVPDFRATSFGKYLSLQGIVVRNGCFQKGWVTRAKSINDADRYRRLKTLALPKHQQRCVRRKSGQTGRLQFSEIFFTPDSKGLTVCRVNKDCRIAHLYGISSIG